MSIHFGDIRAQSGKGSKIGPNLTFSLPNFLEGRQAFKSLDQHL